MKAVHAIFTFVALFSSAICHASVVSVDFGSLNPGDSVEGLGAVHPWLNISTSRGNAVALFDGLEPGTYGTASRVNGGIAATGGFGDVDPDRLHDFIFTFASGVSLGGFSLRMVDHGDYNPGHATQHSVTLEALDSLGSVIDADVLTYTSDNGTNPNSGSAGDLSLTGDALTANRGEPGNFTFSVTGSGIAAVKLTYANNGSRNGPSDPNIAFDSLKLTVVPEPMSLALVLPVLGGTCYWARRKGQR